MTSSDKATELAWNYLRARSSTPPEYETVRGALSAAAPAMREANAMPGREEIAREIWAAIASERGPALTGCDEGCDWQTSVGACECKRQAWAAVNPILALFPAPQPDMERQVEILHEKLVQADENRSQSSAHANSYGAGYDQGFYDGLREAIAALPAQERTG